MWFCQTEKAKKQMKICNQNKCPGCYKCIWIEESSNAMEQYGTVIEPEIEPEIEESDRHPLYDAIKEKFGGEEIE